jgi:hypothetical protein
MIKEFRIRPILAVIPDNADSELVLAPPDPEFWSEMQALEGAGATIAIHGFRHRCNSRGESMLGLHRRSEFAGRPEDLQREWIRAGLEILRGHGLNPRIWVAPRHGFDDATLRALKKEGIGLLSDGFARVPFTRGGLTWIPQQLWGPVKKSKGLWTICVHSNYSNEGHVDQLHAFLRAHSEQFTSVDRVVAEFSPGRLNMVERLYGAFALWIEHRRRARKRRRSRSH